MSKPTHKMSTQEMWSLVDDGALRVAEVNHEINRRHAISNARARAEERARAVAPSKEWQHRFKTVYEGERCYIHWHKDIRTMRLDDWNRVRVVWWVKSNADVYVNFGVSTMHAIMVAQFSGMPEIVQFNPPSGKTVTRRERGELKHLTERTAQDVKMPM